MAGQRAREAKGRRRGVPRPRADRRVLPAREERAARGGEAEHLARVAFERGGGAGGQVEGFDDAGLARRGRVQADEQPPALDEQGVDLPAHLDHGAGRAGVDGPRAHGAVLGAGVEGGGRGVERGGDHRPRVASQRPHKVQVSGLAVEAASGGAAAAAAAAVAAAGGA